MKKLKLESLSLDKFKENEMDLTSSRFISGGGAGAAGSKCTIPTDGSCEWKDDNDDGTPVKLTVSC